METIQSKVLASAGTIIDTPTQRIVAVLFKSPADAVQARSNLEQQGFSPEDIHVFAADDVDRVPTALTELGIPQDVAGYYKVDVRAGMTLVMVVGGERSNDVLNLLRGLGESNDGMDQATENVLQRLEENATSGPVTEVKADLTPSSGAGIATPIGGVLIPTDDEVGIKSRKDMR